MKLYELTKQLIDLEAELENGDLPLGEINAKLDQFGAQFEFKAAQIAKMILNYESDIAQLKAEEERLAARRKILTNRVDYLKKYLLENMNEIGIKNVSYETVRIMVKDNPYSVGEVAMANLPAEFIRVIPEQAVPDKVKILEHFKQTGELPEGVVEIVRSQRLVVKGWW